MGTFERLFGVAGVCNVLVVCGLRVDPNHIPLASPPLQPGQYSVISYGGRPVDGLKDTVARFTRPPCHTFVTSIPDYNRAVLRLCCRLQG